MKNALKRNILLLTISLILLTDNALPLEKPTHEFINKTIASQPWLNNYLKTYLGFDKGVEDEIKGKQVVKWIAEGGIKEDEPLWRTFRHFHDPLKTWDKAGLSNSFLGRSSIIWAQSRDQSYGNYSWQDVRDYYYKALTLATKNEREQNFADTFRGIGQLMHLVQDLSVPAHTRDEPHVGYHYEGFVLNYQKEVQDEYRGKFKLLLSNPFPVDTSIFNKAVYDSLAPVPISALWDQNIYIGTAWIPGSDSIVGLSEYTNANFFSDTTIFQDYPHPKKENTNAILIEHKAEDGEIDKTYYVKGYQSEKLAIYSYCANLDPDGTPEGWKYTLDDDVYEDYTQKLIPRAVGYSAGVLDYFFRGKIDVVEDEDVGGYVIKNDSEEDMDGTFELYYDTKTDERKQIQSGDFPLDTAIPAKGKSSKITFTPPDDAKEPCKYILVFQGRLGNEDGAVIGKSCTLGGPFLFILITKIIKDDWTEAGKNKIKYEGVFYGLAAGGGYGAPVVKSGYKVTFSHLNNVILKVNDVALPSYYWDYDQHFALTGVPATWSIVGDLTYPYGAGVVVNMSNDDWDYGYQFVGVYNAYLQYSNEYIFNNNPQLIGGSWYVNPPGVNCYTAEEKRAYFDFITATFQFNRPTYTRGPVRADWADFVKQQFEGLTGGYVGLAQLDRRVACFGAHCSDGFHAVGFYDNPVRPRLGYYWELPRIWRDSIVGLGVGADGPERLVAGRAGQSADYFTFGLCGWKLVNEHVGYHEPFACSGSPYNCVVEKDDDYGFETKHYLANLDSSNGYMGDECENEGCIPPLPEGGNKWIYADDMTLRFKTADITEGPLKKLWDQYNFHHFEYDIELEITVDTPELVQRTWVE